MAILDAPYLSVEIGNFDLSRFAIRYDQEWSPFPLFQDNVNLVQDGVTYEDSITVTHGIGCIGSKITLLGSNFVVSDNDLIGGIVTKLAFCSTGGMAQDTPVWSLANISIDADKFYEAFKSASPDDEIALLRACFEGDDQLVLSYGDDEMSGYEGNDTIEGRKGADKLDGGSGEDSLYGGLGKDELSGGDGADGFYYSKAAQSAPNELMDIIKDFSSSELDLIVPKGIDANTEKNGNQRFKFIGDMEFGGKAGQLRFADHILSADVDGDGKADFQVFVEGVESMSREDFIL